jgi:hypothetical protein
MADEKNFINPDDLTTVPAFDQSQALKGLTWGQIVKIEPRLDDLLQEIKAVNDPRGRSCINLHWYRSFKRPLCKLVGWTAKKPELRSMEAYDLVYDFLYEALDATLENVEREQEKELINEEPVEIVGDTSRHRFAQAYLRMAREAHYRPGAPSDGMGHIYLSRAQLRDSARLKDEAIAYAIKFYEEEDTHQFHIGVSDYETNRAFMWTIEAARMLAGGLDDVALKLLEMAVAEVRRLRKIGRG